MEMYKKDIRDSSVNIFVTQYAINIPEICYSNTVSIVYNKTIGKRYLRDTLNIPNFILTKSPLNFLDSNAIGKLIDSLKIAKKMISSLKCQYNKEVGRFVWEIGERIILPDDTDYSWTKNNYIIDAMTGRILEQNKGRRIYFID